MDVAREHLWGQLLLERNLVGREDLTRLASERDALVQRGQDCSIGQMLVQQRRLDAGAFASLTREVEGRGRVCYTCRRVFLAVRPEDPRCPQCGGNAALRPPAEASASGRFMAPPSLSGRFPAQPVPGAPGASAVFRAPPAPGASAVFRAPPAPGASAVFRAQPAPPPTGSFAAVPPPTGSFSAVQPGSFFPQPGASASFPAPGGWGAAAAPAASGKFVATPPHSGGFPAMSPPPSGGFSAVDPYDPVGAASPPAPGFTMPASTASEAGEVSSGELGVGKRFGKYEIVQELGRGGMGVVYKVRAPGQPGFLAVKVLLAGEFASAKLMERFREEARLASRLQHPNIVAVHDVGEVDGIPYYAMDYIEGSELQELIRQKNLPVRRGVEILVEVARAAHHAHEHGVVHRDLKPSNILIAATGASYIMDFGLAKNLEDDKGLTRSGVAIGTPYYMPPEQARGSHREMDARSDVYALGAILYEILTRRVPFTAKTQNELLRKIVEEEPQPPRLVKPGVPVELDTIALKALRKVKDDRYESALAMAEDMERWLAGKPILARPEPVWSVLLRKAQKNRTATLAIAGVAALTLLSAVAIWQVKKSHDEERLRAEQRALEEQRQREKDDAERKEREDAERKRQAALAQKQQAASDAVRRGLAKSLEARQVTTVADALRALEDAERLLSDAIALERELSPDQRERPATAYQRALVRRALCRWDDAGEDFTFAAKDPPHRARAHLARALIKLRWEADRDGARVAFGDAVAATGLSPDTEGRDEEATAEGIGRAYLAYLQGNQDAARRRLRELASSARNVMVAEANGALAYMARCDGAPLGGDELVEQGLRPADQALLADAWRYDFLVDRAILRGRAGQLDDALRDLRAARALFPDGEMPDLAEAVVAARRGDAPRMQEALRAAEGKARRSQRVTEEVMTFSRRLASAPRPRTPVVAPNDDRVGPTEPVRQEVTRITGTNEGRVSIPPGNDGQVIQAELIIPNDVVAVRMTVRGAPMDVDLFVHPERVPNQFDRADYAAISDAADETLVMSRTGRPPLRSGKYHVVIRAPKAPPRQAYFQFAVRMFKQGEPLPHPWRPTRDLTFVNVDDKRFEAQLGRAVQARREGDVVRACEALAEVEREAGMGDLAVIRASWLAESGRLDEGHAVLDAMPAERRAGLPATFMRASFFIRASKLKEARRELERFLQLSSDYIDAYTALGDVLLKLGDHAAALALGERLVRQDPHEDAGHLFVGAAEAAQKKAAGVERLREVALNERAESSGRYKAVDLLISTGNAAKALEVIDEYAAKQGERPFVLELMRAEALSLVGRKDDALDLLRTMRARVQSVPALVEAIDEKINKIQQR